MIEAARTIAEIPRNITGTQGKIYSADVYGLAGTRKRKRTELALAIDHQGINLYNVIRFSRPFPECLLTSGLDSIL